MTLIGRFFLLGLWAFAVTAQPNVVCGDDIQSVNRLSGILAVLYTSVDMAKEGPAGAEQARRMLAQHLAPSPDHAMEFVRAYTLLIKRRIPLRLNFYLRKIALWDKHSGYPFSAQEGADLVRFISDYTDWIKNHPSPLDRES